MKKDHQISDEELDRELKLIQLKRERLQLEKDIANRARLDQASKAFSKVTDASGGLLVIVTSGFLQVFTFVKRYFVKAVIAICLFYGGWFALMAYDDHRAEAFYAARNAYVAECGELNVFDMLDGGVAKYEKIQNCQMIRNKEFTRDHRPSLIFRTISDY